MKNKEVMCIVDKHLVSLILYRRQINSVARGFMEIKVNLWHRFGIKLCHSDLNLSINVGKDPTDVEDFNGNVDSVCCLRGCSSIQQLSPTTSVSQVTA